MTAAVWIIAAGIIALAGLAAFVVWTVFIDDGDLDQLTHDDVERNGRPYVERLTIMAADDAPRPDGLRP